MTTSVNYKAADGFVLCWIPEPLRPINILAQWDALKESLSSMADRPQFPTRVFDGVEDEYIDILPDQAREIDAAWQEEHPQMEPEPEPSDDPANEGKEAEV